MEVPVRSGCASLEWRCLFEVNMPNLSGGKISLDVPYLNKSASSEWRCQLGVEVPLPVGMMGLGGAEAYDK